MRLITKITSIFLTWCFHGILFSLMISSYLFQWLLNCANEYPSNISPCFECLSYIVLDCHWYETYHFFNDWKSHFPASLLSFHLVTIVLLSMMLLLEIIFLLLLMLMGVFADVNISSLYELYLDKVILKSEQADCYLLYCMHNIVSITLKQAKLLFK